MYDGGRKKDKAPSYIRFKHIKEVQWQHYQSDSMFIDLMKNHSQQIETFTLKAPKITDKDLQQMNNMVLLERVSLVFYSQEKVKMTVNGFVNFIKSNSQISEVHLYQAKRNFISALSEALKAPGMSGFLETSDQPAREEANVHFVNTVKPAIEWTDDLKFLRMNF